MKEDDRKRALVSRLLQYSLVHHLLRIPFHLINIRRTTEGKPYLVCTLCQILFNSIIYILNQPISITPEGFLSARLHPATE